MFYFVKVCLWHNGDVPPFILHLILGGCERSALQFGYLNPEQRAHGIHWIVDWVGYAPELVGTLWRRKKSLAPVHSLVQTCSTCCSHATCYLQRDLRCESLNPFPGKAEVKHQRNFENLWVVYLWRHILSY